MVVCEMRLAPKPENSNWKMIAGVSMLGGIGFTVSLFIANLSFGTDPQYAEILNSAKLGIVVGSIIAGLLGYMFLNFSLPKQINKD